MTNYLADVICANKEKITEAFVSKNALEKVMALPCCLIQGAAYTWLQDTGKHKY